MFLEQIITYKIINIIFGWSTINLLVKNNNWTKYVYLYVQSAVTLINKERIIKELLVLTVRKANGKIFHKFFSGSIH